MSTTSHSSFDDANGFVALPDNDTVGLSNPNFASNRRKMMDLINRLHATGVQADMDLPMIAVIGSQSAGKSSLIESISGITLPRASGTCTRCPTECKLSSADEAWSCTVSLRFTTDTQGQQLGQARNEAFGGPMLDKSLVEDRIRRAQRAILSPRTPASQFLTADLNDAAAREVAFSSNSICLEIRGRNVADLSFVDLPGMIASGDDKTIIEDLVLSYIKKPSCIILLTVACETDWENQRGFDIVKPFDSEGKRTVGVLTKPDRIGRGDHEVWIDFIKNEKMPLESGWFSVKQPDTEAVINGITWEEARAEEEQFFSQILPWSSLALNLRAQLGTGNLTRRLSLILSALIARRLPELRDELQTLTSQTDKDLEQLGKPPSDDAIMELLHLISEFIQNVSRHVQGTTDPEGLLQATRPALLQFQQVIRSTAPDFRAITSADECVEECAIGDTKNMKASPSFLTNEEEFGELSMNRPIYIDEVMTRATQARSRELPGQYPPEVSVEYIRHIVEEWNVPAHTIFQTTESIFLAQMRDIVSRYFGEYTQGNLHHHVTTIVNRHLTDCGRKALEHIQWLQELESDPRITNDHHFLDYKEKFLGLYRGCYQVKIYPKLSQELAAFEEPQNAPSAHPNMGYKPLDGVSIALNSLRTIDIYTEVPEMWKLLPNNSLDPALDIMSTVRAYFQVAYKRFVDNVRGAIDHDLILGINRNHSLQNALYSGLGITGPEAGKRCEELLAEPPHIVSRRKELLKRKERLESAKRELMDLWLV